MNALNIQSSTQRNLESAFGGESMASRKYLFFADVAKKLGNAELARLFRDTAAQETEHAFAHFRLLHPELVFDHPESLSDEFKQMLLARCLELAIEGEVYEFKSMYPDFAAEAHQEEDHLAGDEFDEQAKESKEHANLFHTAGKNFELLTVIEKYHAERYGVALAALKEDAQSGESEQPVADQWICKKCSMIYDPIAGDPDSGIAPGTPFEAIPDEWCCPICGVTKASFVPYRAAQLKAA